MPLEDFSRLTDVDWRKNVETEQGFFIAEGGKVIERAWTLGYQVRDLVTTDKWLVSISPDILANANVHVYDEAALESLSGYRVHRGALASFERKPLPGIAELIRASECVVVLDGLVDHENVGAIFRSAAGLGADAVILTDDCADPLYRRSIKTSMGATLSIPFTRVRDGRQALKILREHAFKTYAFTLSAQEVLSVDSFARGNKSALIFGSEGHGLSREVSDACDSQVTIPMHHGTDSLNVAQTASIVLWVYSARQ